MLILCLLTNLQQHTGLKFSNFSKNPWNPRPPPPNPLDPFKHQALLYYVHACMYMYNSEFVCV